MRTIPAPTDVAIVVAPRDSGGAGLSCTAVPVRPRLPPIGRSSDPAQHRQIAIIQPIRLEDAVVVEGEWGCIETISSTYVVIRIWDLRRLIVPLSYFVEKPFQNWTHQTADLRGSVHLNVDYTVPMDRFRAELINIVHGSKLWDGKVGVLQVVEAVEHIVQLRALVSARNSSGSGGVERPCHVSYHRVPCQTSARVIGLKGS